VALAPARRRAKLLTLAVTASAELVVGATLFRVFQRFVGLVDGLELLLRTRLLVLVRMVFAGKLAIRRLDVGVAGVGLDPEGLVIILELHRLSRACVEKPKTKDPRWTNPPRARGASLDRISPRR